MAARFLSMTSTRIRFNFMFVLIWAVLIAYFAASFTPAFIPGDGWWVSAVVALCVALWLSAPSASLQTCQLHQKIGLHFLTRSNQLEVVESLCPPPHLGFRIGLPAYVAGIAERQHVQHDESVNLLFWLLKRCRTVVLRRPSLAARCVVGVPSDVEAGLVLQEQCYRSGRQIADGSTSRLTADVRGL